MGDRDVNLSETLALILACDGEVVPALLRHGRLRRIAQRQCIVQQGELLNVIWLVIEGELKIESLAANGRTTRLAVARTGEWLGAYALPIVSLADIVATQPSQLLAFPTGLLPKIVADHPQIGAALALAFARQLEGMIAKLDARATLSAKGRVCAELLSRAGEGLEVSPCPIVAELAQTAQTTRETASRTIAELERRGIISRDDLALRIRSPRILRDMAV